MNPLSNAVQVPMLALPHLRHALATEIAQLQSTHARCGDQRPPGFDPHDMAMLLDVLGGLQPPESGRVFIECAASKPARFTAALITRYLALGVDLPAADAGAGAGAGADADADAWRVVSRCLDELQQT